MGTTTQDTSVITTLDNTSDPGSSSGADATTGDTSTSSSGSSSAGESGASSSGGPVECEDDQVRIEGTCLTPLTVAAAQTVVNPGSPQPSGMPCRDAMCAPGQLPLGGGFRMDGAVAHASHATAAEDGWVTCASPIGTGAGAWQTSARCSIGEGDVLVRTEPHIYDPDTVGCFDVECPGNTTLVGGGARWGSDIRMRANTPEDDGTWQFCGDGLGQEVEVEVDVYCAVLPDRTSVETYEESVVVDSDQSVCVEATCVEGVAVAGGVLGAVGTVLDASFPDPDGAESWHACAHIDSFFSAQMRVRVLCLRDG